MAEEIRYIDTDVSGGAGDGTTWADAYSSRNLWEAAEQTNLVTDGDWHHVYSRASSGTADTTTCDIDGWTTGVSNYILNEAAATDYAEKTGFDTDKYTVEGRILNRENYCHFKGLQFGAQGYSNIFGTALPFGTGTCDIDDCYFNSTESSSEDIEITNMTTVNIRNCILSGNTGTADYGIQCLDDGTVNIYNCIITDRSTGILINHASATVVIKNCAIFNNTDDIDDASSSSVTIDYNSIEDGDGTNNVAASGSDYANEFPDWATGDLTIVNTGNLYEAGVGPSVDASVPTTDIDGTTRSGSTCDIGADEYEAAGSTIPPIAYNYNRRHTA